MSMHGYGSVIRRLAAAGRTPDEIADLYGFDPAAVAWLLSTTKAERCNRYSNERYWKDRPITERPILAQTATRVRELLDQGWSAARIARKLDLDPARVREFARRIEPVRGERLAVPRTRPEQARLERNRRKARDRERAREKAEAERAARWVDEWKAAASEDDRFRDPTTPVVPQPQSDEIPEPEPVDLVADLDPEPRPAAAKRGMKADEWSTWFVRGEAHGAARLTADQVRTIRAQHADGRGLKELAAVYGVHRQTIFMITARRTWTHI